MKTTSSDKVQRVSFDNFDAAIETQKNLVVSCNTAPGHFSPVNPLRTEMNKWRGADPVRHLDPSTVLRSKWSNRHELSFGDDDFRLLKDDIESAGGNIQPIKVRPLAGQDGKFEVVFGHRRHQACVDLGLPVLALIADIDDKKMFVEMDRENRQRKDLRPYEQGLMYAHALDQGLFPSARKMAEAIGVDLTSLGRALTLARLPDFVLEAFVSPLELQYRWVAELNNAVVNRPHVVEKISQQIQSELPRPLAKDVFVRLVKIDANLPKALAAVQASFVGSEGEKASISADPTRKLFSLNLKNIDLARALDLEKVIRKFLD